MSCPTSSPNYNPSGLLSVESAWEKIKQVVLKEPESIPEPVSLDNSLGRVLASPLVSQFASPRFSQSAVDGYGVSLEPLTKNEPSAKHLAWQVVREIQAGDFSAETVAAGQAVRIFTGAPIPPGVEAVIMQEDTIFDTETQQLSLQKLSLINQDYEHPVEKHENVRLEAEEYSAGVTLLPEKTVVTPSVLAVLASQGIETVSVYPFPKIALLSTGNELIQPGQPLAPGQIYDSNAPALTAALRGMGFPSEQIQVFSAVSDTLGATREAFQKALDWADIIISLGGVSVGAYDLVQDVYAELGVTKIFWRLAAKPGKPVYFGTRERASSTSNPKVTQFVWGLPGNPVAAMVTFYELVRPALLARLGLGFQSSQKWQARLSRPLKKKAGRMEWVRGVLTQDEQGRHWQVSPTTGQDSHMILGLAKANALICFPTEASTLQEGDWVSVSPLDWFGLPEAPVSFG